MTNNETARVLAQLSGIEHGVVFSDKAEVHRAVYVLMHCFTHSGVHHFAIVGEGLCIAFSKTALVCLIEAGILPEDWLSK